MSLAFHRGITHELKLKLQQAGIKIEEGDAQRALAGFLTDHITSDAGPLIERAVEDVLGPRRFDLMREWESEHPDQDPFPESFAQMVIKLLQYAEDDDLPNLKVKILDLAQKELLFG